MLVDANILLYATDRSSPHNEPAARWLEAALRGDRRVGLPWQSIGAFLRISTNPRIYANPLSAAQSWGCVRSWLAAEPTWIPPATEATAGILGQLIAGRDVAADLMPDAMLAALAIEHGLTVVSADSDFARFSEVRWDNPLASP